MSHFYGSMTGGRREVTRTGHKTTGIRSHVRTWNLGLKTQGTVFNGTHDDVTGFHVDVTGGSNNPENTGFTLSVTELGKVVLIYRKNGKYVSKTITYDIGGLRV